MSTLNPANRIPLELDGAPRTLLLPLWARAKENQRPHPMLADPRAAQIMEELGAVRRYKDDFQEMDQVFDEYLQLSQLIRAKCIDDEIKPFLDRYPLATVVNIGAGFDTTFNRVDNGRLTWFDLDLPDVIALRRQFIPETGRSRTIAKSVLDFSWCDDIGEPSSGLMFVACGALFFLTEGEVKTLFRELARRFPGSEIVFDGMSSPFLALANLTVLKQTGMGRRAVMRWASPSAGNMARWDSRIAVVTEYPMYSRTLPSPAWDKATRFRMSMANRLRGINIYHLKIQPR